MQTLLAPQQNVIYEYITNMINSVITEKGSGKYE